MEGEKQQSGSFNMGVHDMGSLSLDMVAGAGENNQV